MKPGTEVTVTWLPELAPTDDAWDTAREVFERQTGTKPQMWFRDPYSGTWGWISPDAVLLFSSPKVPKTVPEIPELLA